MSQREIIANMQKQVKPTCVAPGIPSICLHNLAGWLLQAIINCRTTKTKKEAITYFYVDESNYQAATIDAAFVKSFMAEPDTSELKATLIAENACLSAAPDLIVGAEIQLEALDLNDLFQRVVIHALNNPSPRHFTVSYTPGFVRPEDFIKRCMVITADKIGTLSYEQYCLEKAEDESRARGNAVAA